MAISRIKQIGVSSDVTLNANITEPEHNDAKLPTIVFLHFWGGSSRTWSLVTPLVSLEFPTIAIDFRGWGLSTGPDEPRAYTTADLADDIETAIHELKLESIILVGISMGAKVAQLLTIRHGSAAASSGDRERVHLHSIVLVSPAPPTPLKLPEDMREQQIHAYDNTDSAGFVALNVLTSSFHSHALPSFVVEDMLRGNKCAREAWPAYVMAEDISTNIQHIDVPVLVLAAEKDAVEPLDRVKNQVVALIPNVTLEIIADSGHLSPLDAPEAVAQHILNFVHRT